MKRVYVTIYLKKTRNNANTNNKKINKTKQKKSPSFQRQTMGALTLY